ETDYRLITLANPDRLVVDLPAGRATGKLVLPAPAGVVKTIRRGQPEPGTLRIVFDLSEPVAALKPRFEAGPGGGRLVIEWPGDGHADPIARIAAASATVTPAAKDDIPAAPAPLAPSAQTPAPDPAAASAAATSRLVAGLATAQQAARATATSPDPASPPQPQSTNALSLPRAVPSTSSTTASTTTTIAREPAPVPAPHRA